MRGKETYLKQSTMAVLIGLVATLAVGWSQASGTKPNLQSGGIRARTVSSRAFNISPAEEVATPAHADQGSMRVCFAANTKCFLQGLPTGFEPGERVIDCVN